jgi:glutamate formiminotransferase
MQPDSPDLPIVECIPNFSEGRDHRIIDALVQSISEVAGVRVLHQTSDHDHNRSVITFAGNPQAVQDAAFAAIAYAAEHIDMTQHSGEHPRLGATDVVPFVPVRGITLEECVTIAQQVGQRVGDELGLPVYLYEAAATRPQRRNLADVRRGEYEQLTQQIHTPARQPDYGPARVGNAGAVIIGARNALIAYNIFLTTDDVRIAKRIARAVRHSSGGLAGVKALGLLVDGHAQVSMNLVDYKRTPVHRVVEMVRREAAQYGVSIERSELIGLIPQDALLDAAAWYLQLHDFDPAQVLENRLFDGS